MATNATVSIPHLPVGEYLGSVYRPDVDYVDGVLERRNVGEFDHAYIQRAVLLALVSQERALGLRAMQELRVQVSESRYRVPDVCLLPASSRSPVVHEAPYLCVEVLSPRDTVLSMRHRCEDFLRMGVPVIWIFDPVSQVAYVLTSNGMTQQRTGRLEVPGVGASVDIDDIFSVLREDEA